MRERLMRWARRVFVSPAFLYLILAVIFGFIMVHHLGSRPAGLSPAEADTRNASLTINSIRHSPVDAPHSLLALGLHKAGLHWTQALRLSSVLFAAGFLFSFAFLLKAWYGRWVGLMGTVVLAGTPLFLVAARQGSAEIMFFSLSTIMAIHVWALRTTKKNLGLIGLSLFCSIFVYTPGIVLWLIAAAIICRKKLADSFSQASPFAVVAAILLGALILLPLIIAIVQDLSVGKQLLLIPQHYPPAFIILKKIVWAIIAIFFEAPTHQNLILSRLPILNIVEDALLIFGIYALWTAAKTKLFAFVLTIGYAVLAAGFGNNYSLLILGLPVLIIVVCAGLRYLYIEWRSIFPRNPVAHGAALSLMWIVVVVQLLFGIRYAVIAWPATTDTKSVYVLK